MVRFQQRGALLLALLGLLSQPTHVRAAQHAFDIDVKELDQEKPAPPKTTKTTKKAQKEPVRKAHHHHPATHSSAPEGYVRYTIKPGDHLFKILIADFGMSNEKAERLIPEILRENHIDNIRGLTVGKVLLIPLERSHHRSETAKKEPEAARHARVESAESAPVSRHNEEPLRIERAHEPVVKSEPVEKKNATVSVAVPPVKTAVAAPPLAVVAPPPKKVDPPAPPAAAAPVVATPVAVPPAAVPVAAAPLKEAAAKEPVVVATPMKEVAAPVHPKPSPQPEHVVAKAVPEVPAKAPVTAEPKKEASPMPALPAQPPVVTTPLQGPPTWICAVSDSDPHHVVDSMLNALSLKWSKNHVVRSDEGAKTAFSIMVDRYFEVKGQRYIITVGEVDPYNYTLLRLLENTGYKVLRLKKGEGFEVLGDKLLRLVGVAPAFGNYPVAGSDGIKKGFLLGEDDTGGRRILVTREVVGRGEKRVMAEGCGEN